MPQPLDRHVRLHLEPAAGVAAALHAGDFHEKRWNVAGERPDDDRRTGAEIMECCRKAWRRFPSASNSGLYTRYWFCAAPFIEPSNWRRSRPAARIARSSHAQSFTVLPRSKRSPQPAGTSALPVGVGYQLLDKRVGKGAAGRDRKESLLDRCKPVALDQGACA